jgi:hypothetical protein
MAFATDSGMLIWPWSYLGARAIMYGVVRHYETLYIRRSMLYLYRYEAVLFSPRFRGTGRWADSGTGPLRGTGPTVKPWAASIPDVEANGYYENYTQ